MSQIPEAFQGHDLTGWVSKSFVGNGGPGFCLSRLTVENDTVFVSLGSDGQFGIGWCDLDAEEFYGRVVLPLNECFEAATEFANKKGGWAPAPIGYEPSGWQPIETAPKDGTRIILGWADDDGQTCHMNQIQLAADEAAAELIVLRSLVGELAEGLTGVHNALNKAYQSHMAEVQGSDRTVYRLENEIREYRDHAKTLIARAKEAIK